MKSHVNFILFYFILLRFDQWPRDFFLFLFLLFVVVEDLIVRTVNHIDNNWHIVNFMTLIIIGIS